MQRVDQELAAIAAILVEDRVLRRIIKRHRNIGGMGLQVPHAHSYSLPRAELEPLVERGEVRMDLAALPARVTVITGDRAALAADEPAAWVQAWRAVFHARIHDTLDERVARGELTVAMVRERIHALGQIELDEVRSVLDQDDLLLPPGDDVTTYTELVALYLELASFAPRTLARTFPSLHRRPGTAAIIGLDLDVPALLAATRPERAPPQPLHDPAAARPASARASRPELLVPSAAAIRSAEGSAEHARRQGNFARAAMMSCRAADRAAVRADLTNLATRLTRALGGGSVEAWVDALVPLAHAAAAPRVLRYTASARLLLDLQAACGDAERDVEIVDAVTWARTLGKQSIVRTLPATREIRVARRLRAAARKLPACDLGSSDERDRLAVAVRTMVDLANQKVRVVLRPPIEAAFDEVELHPRHLPERVAQKKIVDELLDDAVAVGRLSIGNLRDAIAHNELKLDGLRPIDLVRGDQLLRVDRLLATSLDGVYRRGEIYMRFLQKISSVLAGHMLGRLLTLFVLLPMVASFFVVEGLHHMIAPAAAALGRVEPEIATWPAFIGVAAIVFLLLHAPWFRTLALAGVRGLGHVFRAVVFSIGRVLGRIPMIRPLTRWVLVPGLPALAVWLLLDGPLRWALAAAVLLGGLALVRSRTAEEVVSDWLVRSGRHLTHRMLPGLVKYSLELFGWLMELLERGFYRVDERLRFRPNQSRATAVVKGVLGTVWFAISYVLRLYVNLFVEPTVNPIKHFPVVTVAAKLILPVVPQMISAISGPASVFLGPTLGASFAAFTVLMLPGIAGFLAWEMNGNWKLYRHNRPAHLGEVSFGSHGESMAGLLKLGFHSGTVPKLQAKLRRATWHGNERAVARAKEGLHHVEEALWKFADRQLVSMLNEDLTFRASDVGVHHVDISSNRLRIELVCPSVAEGHTTISFEEQSGWVVASVPEPGWLVALDDAQRRTFEIALTGFYKMAGVDLVREQLETVLAGEAAAAPPYDIDDRGVVAWPGPGFEVERLHDLSFFAARAAYFRRQPVRWHLWATTWEHLSFGMEPAPLVSGPSLLPDEPGSHAA